MNNLKELPRKLKDLVTNGKQAKFAFYRDSTLYYETECGFIFAIPVSDTKGASFNAEEKAVHLMRWIRKQIDANEEARAAQE